MDVIKALAWKETWDVDRRLAELELRRDGLLNVVFASLAAGANATPHHPANAEGTFRYLYGVGSLREQFVGERWCVNREESVEAIQNDNVKVKVAFSNADIACNDERKPKPRSPKGAGSERTCSGNLLFDDLPIFVPHRDSEWSVYHLMVDRKGAAELSRPVISGRTFSNYRERIYLSDGMDANPEEFTLTLVILRWTSTRWSFASSRPCSITNG